MIDGLLKYLKDLPLDQIGSIPIQDIALCQTWYRINTSYAGVKESYAFVPKAVAEWTASQQSVERQDRELTATEARRTQWLLRDIIDVLQQNGAECLTPDELLFILFVYDLTQRAVASSRFDRIRQLLHPYMETISVLVANQASVNGLTGISKRISFALPEDLEQARSREIRVFCGIEMSLIGPIYSAQGHLKILGNVPEHCTVVVEGGSCCIEGYLLGRVAATRHCDTRENISGVVVVRHGDIRARNIVDRALVVSKQGKVFCRQIQNPSLVFAGTEIQVKGNALLGTLMSPRIRIDGDARGGIYHTSRMLQATKFCNTTSQDACIVLRRELSCLEYGEALSEDARRFINRLRTLTYRKKDLSRLLRQNLDEAESIAASTLYYFFATEDVQKSLEKYQAAERRLTVLMRLFQGLQVLALSAEDRLGTNVRPDNEAKTNTSIITEDGSDSSASLREINNELKIFRSQEPADRDLEAAIEEMQQIRNKLDQQFQDKKLASLLLTRTRARMDNYLEEIRKLRTVVQKCRSEFSVIQSLFPAETNGTRPRNALEMLRRLRADNALVGRNPVLQSRLNSSFAQMMWRKIEQHLQLGKQYRDSIEIASREITRIQEELRQNHQYVVFEDERTQECGASVSGKFEKNVLILADPYLIGDSEPPPGSAYRAPECLDAPKTFIRTAAGTIVEQ